MGTTTLESLFNDFEKSLNNEIDEDQLANIIYSIASELNTEIIYPIKNITLCDSCKSFIASETQIVYISDLKEQIQNFAIHTSSQITDFLYTVYASIHLAKHKESSQLGTSIKACFQDVKNLIIARYAARNKSITKSQSEPVFQQDVNAGANIQEVITYRVYYGTNRKPSTAQNNEIKFTGERSDKISYGWCDVSIPTERRLGDIEGRFIDKVLNLNPFFGDMSLTWTEKAEETEFWKEISQQISKVKVDYGEALLFIHGYKNSFKSAALRTAQIAYDLDIKGVAAFFSWPSRNKLLAYSADKDTIEASEQAIKCFILDLAKKAHISKIHIIAHSMGNRALTRIVDDLSKQNSDISFGQIILAAPDIDRNVFNNLANAYKKLSERTTIYVSKKDKAILVSNILHRASRVGLIPPVTTFSGIDTIKVNLNLELFNLQHSYFSDARHVLSDIYYLIHENLPPTKRNGLKQAINDDQEYWVLQ